MKYPKPDTKLMAKIHELEEDKELNGEKLDFLWRAVGKGGATCSGCGEFRTDEADLEWMAEFKECMTTCDHLHNERIENL